MATEDRVALWKQFFGVPQSQTAAPPVRCRLPSWDRRRFELPEVYTERWSRPYTFQGQHDAPSDTELPEAYSHGWIDSALRDYEETRRAMEQVEAKANEVVPDLVDIEPHPSTEECKIEKCKECAVRDCKWNDPMHYHHDGCPSCFMAHRDLGGPQLIRDPTTTNTMPRGHWGDENGGGVGSETKQVTSTSQIPWTLLDSSRLGPVREPPRLIGITGTPGNPTSTWTGTTRVTAPTGLLRPGDRVEFRMPEYTPWRPGEEDKAIVEEMRPRYGSN